MLEIEKNYRSVDAYINLCLLKLQIQVYGM